MKSVPMHYCLLILLAVSFGAGCAGSSDQTEKAGASSAPQAAPPAKSPAVVAAKTDTVNLPVQKAQKPPYETTDPVKTTLPTSTLIKYCVQVGAYKQQDNAGVVASLAKSRFAKNVYTILDPATSLYKVMVGDFTAKDEARMFRDRMVQQYPGDYKDAWVAELSQ